MTTVGRWSLLERLLGSVEASTHRGVTVVVANQSGEPVPASLARFGSARFVESSRGISRGRNAAIRELRGATDLMTFPNDHSYFPDDTLARACRAFDLSAPAGALAGTLLEPAGVRFVLPPSGTHLTRWTVWRAIEPAMFVASPLAESLRFREELGLGGSSPWQAGEGTDLLLRIMEAGRPVVAQPDLIVRGDGERRDLSPDEWRTKLRSYARGVGYVLRLHRAGPLETALQIALPWHRFARTPPGGARTPARDCLQASIGRLEGRLGRCLTTGTTHLDKRALRK